LTDPEVQQKSRLPGVKEMLIGPSGSGKTVAISTWLDCGIKPYCIFTEPSFEVLGDPKWGNALSKIDWDYLPPANTEFSDILRSATLINQMTLKGLSNLDDINKNKHQEFMKLVSLMNEKQIDKFGTDRVVVLDSLSGLNIMAMDNEERLIQKLCTGLNCHFMLTAHAELERDEVTGQTFIMAGTLGRKLAPKLPRFFSDVIYCKREGATFSWSTVEMGADLKARNLDYKAGIKPSFVQVIDVWKARGGLITAA
jgi:hypothetical protein